MSSRVTLHVMLVVERPIGGRREERAEREEKEEEREETRFSRADGDEMVVGVANS